MVQEGSGGVESRSRKSGNERGTVRQEESSSKAGNPVVVMKKR